MNFPIGALTSADADTALMNDYQHGDSSAFLTLIRKHNRAIFHLAHSLVRNEVAAENITQQVFARARRHINQGHCPVSISHWLYYATLRFSRHHQWHAERRLRVRRMSTGNVNPAPAFNLQVFARVIATQPGKIEPRDSELLALHHVLGLAVGEIARLLRTHPYETSNRLIWARERVLKLSGIQSFDAEGSHAALAMSA
ncbi:RNA polymerase sigma factor [Rariglobus hedericola]|uniref:Sigma-70 family RNA polymerase sigma factor n=1 Tax=Rariglobus hedericola TaxID=2597822 RepID=A0A556QLA0_9BACT|nr:hypothetical protein [Rariglobus hedericola]TSJ77419.1 hypothetical protein FPL22_15120 [Rariglobus hedericola]